MKSKAYFNGKIIDLEKVKISPLDIGMLRGYGVFDVMRTVNGKLFLWEEHFKRLRNYARELKLGLPFGREEYHKTLLDLLAANRLKEASIRTVLTGGVSPDGFSIGRPTCYILVEELHTYPADFFRKGVKLMTIEHERVIPEAKTLNYIEAIKNQDVKKQRGAFEVIYTGKGKIFEAATSNFFIVRKGVLITPKSGVLHGVTRNLVISLARKSGFKVIEKDIFIKDLKKAEEAFLTATSKGIIPVVRIDDKMIGKGKVGEKTKELMGILNKYLKSY